MFSFQPNQMMGIMGGMPRGGVMPFQPRRTPFMGAQPQPINPSQFMRPQPINPSQFMRPQPQPARPSMLGGIGGMFGKQPSMQPGFNPFGASGGIAGLMNPFSRFPNMGVASQPINPSQFMQPQPQPAMRRPPMRPQPQPAMRRPPMRPQPVGNNTPFAVLQGSAGIR
tara:strand:- start:44 stop:547 length:504 start_codon:yes stop_codon:yes gene_type:complete